MEADNDNTEERLVELLTHLSGCSITEARSALLAVGPRAEGLNAVAQALALLRGLHG